MATTSGQDLSSDLQLMYLRRRIEELERENQILLSQISSCRCSGKGEGPQLPPNSSASSSVTSQSVQMHPDHHISNHSSTCFTHDAPIKKHFSTMCLDKSTRSSKNGSKERPGYQLSTVENCAKRYVALKVMYFGQRFYGFASEAQLEPTIELEVFKALARTKLLVGNKVDSHYYRCGRTDKGVSSTGQVISLYLRSNLKDSGGIIRNEEIDYVKVLNKVLPKDICIIGWCSVPTDFSARFSCLSREYKYLFWRGTLDILVMQNAARKFIGDHDFRNFCKMDAANVKNYTRHITEFTISSCSQRSDVDELWAMTIRGSAFLWHQVRCMVAVLFMIGQGLESPKVLDELLDIKKTPKKPQYNMAPEVPLILRSCEFQDVNFMCSSDARRALHEHLTNEFHTYMLQAAIYREALSCFSTPEESSSEPWKKKRSHISLLLRPTEPSYEERRAKLDLKALEGLKACTQNSI